MWAGTNWLQEVTAALPFPVIAGEWNFKKRISSTWSQGFTLIKYNELLLQCVQPYQLLTIIMNSPICSFPEGQLWWTVIGRRHEKEYRKRKYKWKRKETHKETLTDLKCAKLNTKVAIGFHLLCGYILLWYKCKYWGISIA